MSFLNFMYSEVHIQKVDKKQFPYINDGDKVATIKDREGNEVFCKLISSHPFDGDDYRCGKTGTRHNGIWKSSAWKTAKI